MTKQVAKRFFVVLAITCLGLGALYLFNPMIEQRSVNVQTVMKHLATKEQFDQVQIGMSEEQVEAILGPPSEKTEVRATDADGNHIPVVWPYYYAGVGDVTIEIKYYLRKVTAKRWVEPQR